MGRGILREARDLLLHLLVPAVGAPAAAFGFEGTLLDDPGAEPLGGAPQRRGEGLVVGRGPEHQEPAPPLFPHQVLRQRVRQHGARRRGMHEVRPAILLAQPVVGRAGIEDQRGPVLERIGERKRSARARIRDHEGGAVLDLLPDLRDQLSDIAVLHHLEREVLLEEPAGGVVVVDGEPCARNTVIGRRDVEQRERRRRIAQLAREHDRDTLRRPGCADAAKTGSAASATVRSAQRSNVPPPPRRGGSLASSSCMGSCCDAPTADDSALHDIYDCSMRRSLLLSSR